MIPFASPSFQPCRNLLNRYARARLSSLNDIFMSVSIVTTAAAAWDWMPGLSWSFVEWNVDDVLKPFAHPRNDIVQHRSTKANGLKANVEALIKGAFDWRYSGIGIHEIEVRIPSFLRRCYFKHIFIILVSSKRQTYRFKLSLNVFLFRNTVNRTNP